MDLAASLKEAIHLQNRHWLIELFEHPDFIALNEQDLNALLDAPTPLLVDPALLIKICKHPSIRSISASSLAHLTLLSIWQGSPALLDFCFSHPRLKEVSGELAGKLATEALLFHGKNVMEELMIFPSFREFFKHHPALLIQCALRTNDQEWLEELLDEFTSEELSPILARLLNWAIEHKNKRILSQVLRTIQWDASLEKNFLQMMDLSEDEELRYYLALQLAKHQGENAYSSYLLSWMLQTALMKQDKGFIYHLLKHPAYPAIPPEGLLPLIFVCLENHTDDYLKHFIHHPQFAALSGNQLGLILEEAASQGHYLMTEVLLRHPHFQEVPEDAFKRMALQQARLGQAHLQNFIQHPYFKQKYSSLVYEAIRRNETFLIDLLLRQPLLKQWVVEELVHYTTTDSQFVSLYIIRDVIREILVANDNDLISLILTNSLFKDRIQELIKQSIQFDDDEIIEKFLINPLLAPTFAAIWKDTPLLDKQRIRKIFENSNYLNKLTLH